LDFYAQPRILGILHRLYSASQSLVEEDLVVKTAGFLFLGQTHVKEARRSACSKKHSLFLCNYNTWALNIVCHQTIEKQHKIIKQQSQ
jgi:hypothetical protein